jgi:hypothetical protein
MSTIESLGILLFICSGNESNSRSQNRFKHSGETISRKFEEVLFSLMSMANDFIRPKDPNYSEDADFVRFDRDPNYMPTIPERYKRDAVLANA